MFGLSESSLKARCSVPEFESGGIVPLALAGLVLMLGLVQDIRSYAPYHRANARHPPTKREVKGVISFSVNTKKKCVPPAVVVKSIGFCDNDNCDSVPGQ